MHPTWGLASHRDIIRYMIPKMPKLKLPPKTTEVFGEEAAAEFADWLAENFRLRDPSVRVKRVPELKLPPIVAEAFGPEAAVEFPQWLAENFVLRPHLEALVITE
ncbi:MAG: hypothetical protein MAG451_00315 [Anaerolineales bacterium]|nr:hypothetical protein [Anaerolineales bacterium]